MNRSVLIALGLLVGLTVYMLTGLVGCGGPAEAGDTPAAEQAKPLMTVQVREMTAEEISREVMLNGKTAPNRAVDIKAETAGKVVEVANRRGLPLADGDLIARIEMKDREQRLEQARAALEQASILYDAALRLQKQELNSPSQVAEALSRLRGAEQLVQSMELDIRNTNITAPFDGVLQERMVEVGDYLGIGDPVARVIDLDPVIISGEVTEFEIGYIKVGEPGHARLTDGRMVDGKIRYVAGEADRQAHTFTIELEVPNPDQSILAGVTARIAVETEQVLAYEISPALISIADDGRFGIKIVDENNIVRFVEADIVRSEPDILWLANLPPKIRLITTGQGFTQPGDEVEVEMEKETWQ